MNEAENKSFRKECQMTAKEQLWYLIKGLINGSYEVSTFCDEFTRIYNLETDYAQLSAWEHKSFGELCEMAGRFSKDEEELKIPHVYFSREEILSKAKRIAYVENLESGHGISFEPGLAKEELEHIEALYNLRFPKSLREFRKMSQTE